MLLHAPAAAASYLAHWRTPQVALSHARLMDATLNHFVRQAHHGERRGSTSDHSRSGLPAVPVGSLLSEMETFAMTKNICMPDVTSGDNDQPITYRQIVVVIVVLAFAALLLWAGLAPAEAAWLTGTLAATAALLTRRLGGRG